MVAMAIVVALGTTGILKTLKVKVNVVIYLKILTLVTLVTKQNLVTGKLMVKFLTTVTTVVLLAKVVVTVHRCALELSVFRFVKFGIF